ncbi:hypothetical protein SK128_015025 [Halocaridina rubra]|uniref:Uncharacterized protein n=1 Tax=Halocaridina rubra TaxID=373956 RepID=A0AAN8WC09_HALRR
MGHLWSSTKPHTPILCLSDAVKVQVFEDPNASLECPPLVAVKSLIECNFTAVSQGQDYELTSSYTEFGAPAQTYKVPGEVTSLYGATIGSSIFSSTTTFAAGDFVILHTAPARKGRIARVEVNADVAGWVAIYGVRPLCGSGEYCWERDQCNTGCTMASSVLTCSTGHLCPSEARCTVAPCPASTTASTSQLNYHMISSISVNMGVTVTNLPDSIAAEVHDGERLAVGCISLADCQNAPAAIYNRNSSVNENQDQLAIANTTLMLGDFSSEKLLVRVLVSDDPVIPLAQEFTCEGASSVPVSLVPTPYDATTEDYVLQGFHNISYTEHSSDSLCDMLGILRMELFAHHALRHIFFFCMMPRSTEAKMVNRLIDENIIIFLMPYSETANFELEAKAAGGHRSLSPFLQPAITWQEKIQLGE